MSLVRNHPLAVGYQVVERWTRRGRTLRRRQLQHRFSPFSTLPPPLRHPLRPLLLPTSPKSSSLSSKRFKPTHSLNLSEPKSHSISRTNSRRLTQTPGSEGGLATFELASRAGVVEMGVGKVMGSHWVCLRREHREVARKTARVFDGPSSASSSSSPY